VQLKDLQPSTQLKPKKGAMVTNNGQSIDQFLVLVIHVFGCLLKQNDMFLHDCANVIWSLKGPKGPQFLSQLLSFVKKFQSHCKVYTPLPS
jgi:hypothetical protein